MKKLEKILKLVTMNRPALLGYSMLASGIVGGIYSFFEKDMNSLAFYMCNFLGGAFILSGTDFGGETYRVYERTKGHIQKHERLDEEVVKLYSKCYCERQGVYIAAKELGYLEDYKKAIKNQKIIISNF